MLHVPLLLARHAVKLAIVHCETTHSVCKGDTGWPVPLWCCMSHCCVIYISLPNYYEC